MRFYRGLHRFSRDASPFVGDDSSAKVPRLEKVNGEHHPAANGCRHFAGYLHTPDATVNVALPPLSSRNAAPQQALFSGFGGRKAPSDFGEISIAGVLRLRAQGPASRDKSVRRCAQDDAFLQGLKNIWSGPKNTRRSKKSQALRMTILWRGLKNNWPRQKKYKKFEKVTSSQDDAFPEGLKKHLVGSKKHGKIEKSQALRMTILWRG